MSVIAIVPDYTGPVMDSVDKYHGNQILFIGWDQHATICAPIALPLPPAMPFGDLLNQVLPTTAFAEHPDWPRVDWRKVQWLKSGQPLEPDPDKSLIENGLGHKDVIRMRTPELTGINGSINNMIAEVNGSIGNLSTTALGAVNTGTIVSGVDAAVAGIVGSSTGGSTGQ